jgi:hypothetical protein
MVCVTGNCRPQNPELGHITMTQNGKSRTKYGAPQIFIWIWLWMRLTGIHILVLITLAIPWFLLECDPCSCARLSWNGLELHDGNWLWEMQCYLITRLLWESPPNKTPCHPNRDWDYAANITKFPTIQLNLSTLKVSPYPVYGLINLSPVPKQQQTFSIESKISPMPLFYMSLSLICILIPKFTFQP